MQLNRNQEIVLEKLKSEYNYEYFIGDIYHFHDVYTHEMDGSETSEAYKSLSKIEEIQVIKEYIKYLEMRDIQNDMEA